MQGPCAMRLRRRRGGDGVERPQWGWVKRRRRREEEGGGGRSLCRETLAETRRLGAASVTRCSACDSEGS
eukprot:2062684-Rhodomonas_salina.1